MFCKFGKEKKLFKNNSFRVKYGTVDAAKLNAIYVDIESWVQPTEMIKFDSSIRITRNKILNKLKDEIDKTFFADTVIVDLDLRSSGMALNKKSFMCIEVTVYPKEIHKFNSEIVKKNVMDIALNVISVVQQNKYKFYAKKTQTDETKTRTVGGYAPRHGKGNGNRRGQGVFDRDITNSGNVGNV